LEASQNALGSSKAHSVSSYGLLSRLGDEPPKGWRGKEKKGRLKRGERGKDGKRIGRKKGT